MRYIILFTIFLSNFLVFAQEETASDSQFPLGTFLRLSANSEIGYAALKNSGLNTVIQYGNSNTFEWLKDFNVIAENTADPQDLINHYAMGYYTKWEAEESQQDEKRTGLLHSSGKSTQWNNKSCWSTIGTRGKILKLVYGPHYRQDKKYRQHYYSNTFVNYTARFRLALDYNQNKTQSNESVCVIKVVYKYTELFKSKPGTWKVREKVLSAKTLKINEFPENGNFENFELNYSYGNMLESKPSTSNYLDKNENNGIQFQIDWLDPEGELYLDHIEVFDSKIWKKFLNDPETESKRLKEYARRYFKYSNLKYWYACDEPNTIDSFTPLRMIDSLITSIGGPPVITEFYPPWDVNVNGDVFMKKYYEMVKPQQLMIDIYPISPNTNPSLQVRLESLRKVFALAHNQKPGFWYVAQAFGWQQANGNWCIWKKPTEAEFKALVMLALSHGAKGIMTWAFPTRDYTKDTRCGGKYTEIGLVDKNFRPTKLYNVIRTNISPRLNGNLGITLLDLRYTGEFININNLGNTPSTSSNQDYLTIDRSGRKYHWHAGFFEKKDQPDIKYFMLTNLYVKSNVAAQLEISNKTEFKNLSFKDVEGKLADAQETVGFNSSKKIYVNVPAGEGYLFQLAPAVKYGGNLIYDEDINENITLEGNLIIKNNATLKINSDYYVKGKIATENGKIEYGKNGVIHYLNKGNSINSADIEDTIK
ncbi:MAG: hypothetical protein KJN64_07960 [Ignavibacteria bacterium]|nr:hypothetical protein [Ignavibacteria bacterium]